MVRSICVSLSKSLDEYLANKSQEFGLSKAELIRRCIQNFDKNAPIEPNLNKPERPSSFNPDLDEDFGEDDEL